MDRTCLSAKQTAVRFLGHNSKHKFCTPCFWSTYHKFRVNLPWKKPLQNCRLQLIRTTKHLFRSNPRGYGCICHLWWLHRKQYYGTYWHTALLLALFGPNSKFKNHKRCLLMMPVVHHCRAWQSATSQKTWIHNDTHMQSSNLTFYRVTVSGYRHNVLTVEVMYTGSLTACSYKVTDGWRHARLRTYGSVLPTDAIISDTGFGVTVYASLLLLFC